MKTVTLVNRFRLSDSAEVISCNQQDSRCAQRSRGDFGSPLASCTAAKFLPVTGAAAGFAERCKRSISEAFGEKAVTEPAVADYQRALSQLVHYRSDDACTG